MMLVEVGGWTGMIQKLRREEGWVNKFLKWKKGNTTNAIKRLKQASTIVDSGMKSIAVSLQNIHIKVKFDIEAVGT